MPTDALDARIIALFTDEPRMSVLEASRTLQVARATVQARLDRMQKAGIISGVGCDDFGKNLLDRLNKIKPVWIELGLQTIHQKTADYIRRGYALDCYEAAVDKLHALRISVITHVILGLPGETKSDILETVRYLNKVGTDGVKLQLLHVLKDTDLADDYLNGQFKELSLEEYIDIIINSLEVLSPDIVIHRLTGDGPKKLLLAPLWSSNKKHVLNTLHSEIRRRNTYQGKEFLKHNGN